MSGKSSKINFGKIAWQTAQGAWELDFSQPQLMAIINLTPDSFSDGGRFQGADEACQSALAAVEDGANILDLGAESTRPGATFVPEDDEWQRLSPVLSKLTGQTKAAISIDTYKASVAEKAILAGAAIINDIYAGRKDPAMFEIAAKYQVPLILMHMQGEPDTMQLNPQYDDVVLEIHDFLQERAEAAEKAGVPKNLIWLDPGVGFGKNVEHNLTILQKFDEIIPEGYLPVMALSRKMFLGKLLGGVPAPERDHLTSVAGAISILKGAKILRVHNVPLNRDAAILAKSLI